EALAVISQRVLGDDEEDQDVGTTRFEGKETELKTVCDELLTVSMWGNRRLVVVDDADEFVSQNRSGLEKYLEKPAKKSVLVLTVKSWPKSTRLAKAVAKIGLALECAELKGSALLRWLSETCRSEFDKQLTRDAAALMMELAGTELGLLNQELAKLSAYVGEKKRIDAEDVRKLVGGWKAETTWAMTDAVRDGKLDQALIHLDKLLVSGEAPQRILGGLGYVFRKYAQATEWARQTPSLQTALNEAGVFPRDVGTSSAYLRRIGRPRAETITNRLLEADGNMKGNSRTPERIILEHLLVQLSGTG
ncbi:MAG: DNA polymerase III subunit delta, partial [Planctomycetes bacterium]|nr:DNA polymerase III subunit delta [Planctomycetota bacterium]